MTKQTVRTVAFVNVKCLDELAIETSPTSKRSALRSDEVYSDLKKRLLIGEFPIDVRLGEHWRMLSGGPLPTPDPSFVLVDESFHVGLAAAAGNEALFTAHLEVSMNVVRDGVPATINRMATGGRA